MPRELFRACAKCEKEFGPVQTHLEKTHGYCRRHYVEVMLDAGFTPEEISRSINEMTGTFPPDLSETEETTI